MFQRRYEENTQSVFVDNDIINSIVTGIVEFCVFLSNVCDFRLSGNDMGLIRFGSCWFPGKKTRSCTKDWIGTVKRGFEL